MSDQPFCGKCGKVMTPKDSTIHPEYFLHDACLPDELKPAAPKRREPTHLGDGAYATDDAGNGIWLTANHHERGRATGAVYLEFGALEALCRWYFGEKLWRAMADAANHSEAG